MQIFSESLSQAQNDFETIKPMLSELLKGDFIMLEGIEESIAQLLDIKCGIDYIMVKDGVCYSIASRIQRGKPYNTFTVRKERESGTETECEKRLKAIKHGGLYPHYTIQAYLSDDGSEVLSIGVAYTDTIYKYIERGYGQAQHTTREQSGQASFIVCEWSDLIDKKEVSEKLYIYERDKKQWTGN